ncbi:MAG: PocR ligand-binding domain-containing protein [Oscillospiraceae bacterium]|nr:PocR ligand-binding domain-containing protein [Oscillospiraceae bacterium]
MARAFSDIYQIINPNSFQKIQDDISIASELAIITVDYKGVPITLHSNCSEFCKKMRSSKYGVYCEKCDSHGGLEAARIGKPFIYLCHAGLIDFAIPIIVDGLYVGALMAGQILLDDCSSENKPERILQGVSNSLEFKSDPEFQQSYGLLPVMRLEKVVALANMLSHIGDYSVEQAVLREAITQQRSKNQSVETVESLSNPTTEIYSAKTSVEPNKLLQPALLYIKKHPQEKITLYKMASLCSISTSYFSKLFSKENLGNLSDYVNRIKMERAKELLVSTDWSIGTIAENMGFDDCGYFIKVFKRETNRTPLEYRNIHNSSELSQSL